MQKPACKSCMHCAKGDFPHAQYAVYLHATDKFWLDQPVMFDWKADLTRTGNRSLKCDISVD